MAKLKIEQAVVVEGRDDVRAVQEAAEALIIPTHGYGISAETWQMLDKAYEEKGLIVFTDPDHAGREIRKRLSDKYPEAIQAHLDREDARDGSDIGIENAKPEHIAEALEKAISLSRPKRREGAEDKKFANMSDLTELGLAGGSGASEKRALVCKALGIGYSNANSLIKKLKGFEIGLDELKEALEKIK